LSFDRDLNKSSLYQKIRYINGRYIEVNL